MTDLNPIAIILATSGSKGNRILFRYPPETVKKNAVASKCKFISNVILFMRDKTHLLKI